MMERADEFQQLKESKILNHWNQDFDLHNLPLGFITNLHNLLEGFTAILHN